MDPAEGPFLRCPGILPSSPFLLDQIHQTKHFCALILFVLAALGWFSRLVLAFRTHTLVYLRMPQSSQKVGSITAGALCVAVLYI